MINHLEAGSLSLSMSLMPDAQDTVRQLQQAVRRQTWMMVGVGLFLAGVVWRVGGGIAAALAQQEPPRDAFSVGCMIVAALCVGWGLLKHG